MNLTKQSKRLINDVRRWCASPAGLAPALLRDDIRAILKSPRPRAVQMASVNLGLLANWHGQHGIAAILDGNEGGWEHIERSLQYLWWSIRIEPSNAMVSKAACCLAHTIVSQHESYGDYLWERLLRSIEDNSFLTWKHSPFGTFMLHLWSLHKKEPFPTLDYSKVPRLGPYQKIIDGWLSGDALAVAMTDICDYHLEQTRDALPLPEFVHPPYNLFPVEVIAIFRVRMSLDLPTPSVSHPLLSTPLSAPATTTNISVIEEDEVLQEIVSRAKQSGIV